MRTFEKWNELANTQCVVIIDHAIFDEKTYVCDNLGIINDDLRIGVVVKGKELFVYKQDVINFWTYENAYVVEDPIMKITIVNKM